MGFRFFRRVNVLPGVRLNLSKSGISSSFGVRGARVTLGRTGVRKTVGIPVTGLFYTEVAGSGRGRSRGGCCIIPIAAVNTPAMNIKDCFARWACT